MCKPPRTTGWSSAMITRTGRPSCSMAFGITSVYASFWAGVVKRVRDIGQTVKSERRVSIILSRDCQGAVRYCRVQPYRSLTVAAQ